MDKTHSPRSLATRSRQRSATLEKIGGVAASGKRRAEKDIQKARSMNEWRKAEQVRSTPSVLFDDQG